jgi:alcohol dehydrogenase class IV
MNFEFATAGRILFGQGGFGQTGKLAAELGRCALIVTGRSAGRADPLAAQLEEQGLEIRLFSIEGEPTVEEMRSGSAFVRQEGCDLVIGLGGGSAMDAAKAIAMLATNPGDPDDYLEVIGRGRSLTRAGLPVIAIPTTAGSGAEVTRNAVLASKEHQVKVSLRSPMMLPKVALVDPDLTYNLPPEVTASTGMDALTQLIEPFVSNKANPLVDSICREGMARAAGSLRRVYHHGEDGEARRDMALASLFGGLALANAKLGAVHGLASVLGGVLDAPHGAVCARLLPTVMAANVQALQLRGPGQDVLRRYTEIARTLCGNVQASAQDGVAWIEELAEELRIPPLSTYGLEAEAFPDIIEKAAISSSMQGNPIRLTAEETGEILRAAL